MPRTRHRTPDELRCMKCGQACPCDLYKGMEPHAHCPGGIDDYLLCEACEKECLAIHRPVDANGKWKWVDCTDPTCGYCQATGRLRGKLAYPPPKETP